MQTKTELELRALMAEQNLAMVSILHRIRDAIEKLRDARRDEDILHGYIEAYVATDDALAILTP